MVRKKQTENVSRGLIEAMNFLEGVSAKIHGLLDQAKIYRTLKKAFAGSKGYTATVLLLTADGSKLRIAETSLSTARKRKNNRRPACPPSSRRSILPGSPQPRLKGRKIDLGQSSLLKQVVRDGKTVQSKLGDALAELLPPSTAQVILENMPGKKRSQTILTPLRRDSEVIGAFVMSSPQLSEQLIPSVERLAQHISTALALAQEYADRKRVEEELRSSREELRSLSGYLQSVREEERTHIARELHDQLGQALTAQKMDLSWLEEELPEHKKALEKIRSMSTLSDTTIDTVQRICTELRPRSLDDLGLAAAIEWQAQEFEERTGMECSVALDSEDIALDKDLSTALFRIFQEALTNVARHANATRVNVGLVRKGSQLQLKVKDNGKGITQRRISGSKSFGLIGIRERVRSLGGEFRIKGIRGKGTTVTVSIPLLDPVRRRLTTTPRLVGREKELRQLKSLLERAGKSEGGFALVHGEAGIGKTRLVTEFGQDLETRGGRVLLGGCHEDTRTIPYYPFREAFNRFLEVRKEEGLSAFENLPAYSQWELARILPGLEGPKPSQFEPAKDPFRLFEAFRLFIQQLSARTSRPGGIAPLLLILEDLHLSGEASLDLLHYLARNLRESRVLLCATYRTEEAGESLRRFTDSLQKEKLSEALLLEPLSPQGVSTMVDLLYPGAERAQEFRDSLYERTEGNPFFVEELIKLVPEGEVTEALTKMKKIPKSIQAVLQRRVNSLDTGVRETLSCAALVGEEFEFEVLRGALDRPEMEVMDAVEVGARTHIIRESTRGEEERYRFIHALMADVLYSGIGKARRRLWHGRVGEALEQVYAARLADLNGRLVYHFELGENWEKALDYALKAARQAKEAYSNQEAIQLYEQAREMVPRLTRECKEERIAIAEELGTIYDLIGDYDRSIEIYTSALELTEEKNKRAEIYTKIGETYGHKGEYDEAIRICDDALELIEDMECRENAFALSTIAAIYERKGMFENALEQLEKSLQIAENVRDKRVLATCLNGIAAVLYGKGEFHKALGYLKKVLPIWTELGDQLGVAMCYKTFGATQVRIGDFDGGLVNLSKSLEIAEKIGNLAVAVHCHGEIGYIHFWRGEYDRALANYDNVFKKANKIGEQYAIAAYFAAIGKIQFSKGEYEKALESFEDSTKRAKALGFNRGLALNYLTIAEIYAKLRDLETAMSYSNKAMNLCKEYGLNEVIVEAMRVQGVVYRERKMWNESIETFENCIGAFDKVGMKGYWLGEAYYDYALMWRDKGEPEKARVYLNKAMDIFEKSKSERKLTEAKTVLEALKTDTL